MNAQPLPVALQAIVIAVAIAAAIFDIRSRRIPNFLALSGVVAGVATNVALEGLKGLATAAAGMTVAFGIYFLFYLTKGVGAGDVKLMTAVGALVGPLHWLRIFAFAAIIGGGLALGAVIVRGRLRETLHNVAFMLSRILTLRSFHIHRPDLDVKNPGRVRMPHGVAIALGTILYMSLLWNGLVG